MKSILTLLLTVLSLNLHAYQYDVSICSVFQNEAPYMKEWIEYHRSVGVKHFWLYNNESTDNYKEVLKPYIKEGIVELVDWPNKWPDIWFVTGAQVKAFADAIKRAQWKTKWLAVIDLDEFIIPVQHKSLIDCLDTYYDDCVGVCVNWQCYGTSGVPFIDKNELMIEKLTWKGPLLHDLHYIYKSIVKPEFVTDCISPHFCVYLEGYNHVDANLELPVDGLRTKNVLIDKIRINHYWSRDEKHFHEVKIPRWLKWNASPQYMLDLNAAFTTEQDYIMEDFVPDVKKRLKCKKPKFEEKKQMAQAF